MTDNASSAVMTTEPGPEYRRGVGILMLNRAGNIFVAERIDTPGAWQMPQGGIDKGETPIAAAWRELAEETGVHRPDATFLGEARGWLRYDLPDALRGKVWKGRFVGQAQKWFAMRLEGPDTVIEIEGEHAEFSRWRWAAPEDLPDLIVAFKRPLYEALLNELAPVIRQAAG